jgi:hypothetical protein
VSDDDLEKPDSEILEPPEESEADGMTMLTWRYLLKGVQKSTVFQRPIGQPVPPESPRGVLQRYLSEGREPPATITYSVPNASWNA